MSSNHAGARAPALHAPYVFRITTDLCPQVLLRILGLMTPHVELPRTICCVRHHDRIHAEIAVDGITPDGADLLLAKISVIVAVRDAQLSRS